MNAFNVHLPSQDLQNIVLLYMEIDVVIKIFEDSPNSVNFKTPVFWNSMWESIAGSERNSYERSKTLRRIAKYRKDRFNGLSLSKQQAWEWYGAEILPRSQLDLSVKGISGAMLFLAETKTQVAVEFETAVATTTVWT
jgi:hypothetical protein